MSSNKTNTDSLNRKRLSQTLIHICLWFVVLFVPYIVMSLNGMELRKSIHFFLSYCSLLIVFYINYFFLVDKLLFNKKYAPFIIANVILIFGCIIAGQLIKNSMGIVRPTPPPPPHGEEPREFFHFFFYVREAIVLFAIAGLSMAIKATTRWFASEQEKQQLEKERLESELKNLKSQLNPHFLFNTLNNIYSLTISNTEKAQEGIQELSSLLRYVLYESNQEVVPLKKEIDFVQSYINLMSLRLNENTKLTVELPEHVSSQINIAPLLFISLIENAFKHGLKSARESFIIIKIKVMETSVICSVLNSNYKTDNDNKVDSGIGLDNLKRRLSLLYPDSHTFILEDRKDAFLSELEIILSKQVNE